MDIGFDARTLVINHAFFALWTGFFFPGGNPLSLLGGPLDLARGAVFALWALAGVALLVMDAIVAYRLLVRN